MAFTYYDLVPREGRVLEPNVQSIKVTAFKTYVFDTEVDTAAVSLLELIASKGKTTLADRIRVVVTNTHATQLLYVTPLAPGATKPSAVAEFQYCLQPGQFIEKDWGAGIDVCLIGSGSNTTCVVGEEG